MKLLDSFRGRSSSPGFTLIELLVVILIVAILIAIAAPSFLTNKDKAYDSNAIQQLATARTELKAQWTSSGQVGYEETNSADLAAAINDSEPQQKYIAYQDPGNAGVDVLSLAYVNKDSAVVCIRSQSSTVFCLRSFENQGTVVQADSEVGDPTSELLAAAARPASNVAYAASDTPTGKNYKPQWPSIATMVVGKRTQTCFSYSNQDLVSETNEFKARTALGQFTPTVENPCRTAGTPTVCPDGSPLPCTPDPTCPDGSPLPCEGNPPPETDCVQGNTCPVWVPKEDSGFGPAGFPTPDGPQPYELAEQRWCNMKAADGRMPYIPEEFILYAVKDQDSASNFGYTYKLSNMKGDSVTPVYSNTYSASSKNAAFIDFSPSRQNFVMVRDSKLYTRNNSGQVYEIANLPAAEHDFEYSVVCSHGGRYVSYITDTNEVRMMDLNTPDSNDSTGKLTRSLVSVPNDGCKLTGWATPEDWVSGDKLIVSCNSGIKTINNATDCGVRSNAGCALTNAPGMSGEKDAVVSRVDASGALVPKAKLDMYEYYSPTTGDSLGERDYYVDTFNGQFAYLSGSYRSWSSYMYDVAGTAKKQNSNGSDEFAGIGQRFSPSIAPQPTNQYTDSGIQESCLNRNKFAAGTSIMTTVPPSSHFDYMLAAKNLPNECVRFNFDDAKIDCETYDAFYSSRFGETGKVNRTNYHIVGDTSGDPAGDQEEQFLDIGSHGGILTVRWGGLQAETKDNGNERVNNLNKEKSGCGDIS